MILEIKKVNRCKNGAFGSFVVLGRERARITISLERNKMLADYGATLLHELLHCYTTLLRVEGFKCTNKKEHKWIEKCETAILSLMQKSLK